MATKLVMSVQYQPRSMYPGQTAPSRIWMGGKGEILLKVHLALLQGVRNMGNFNFSKTHVLTFFHHVEQCCYYSIPSISHIPAMTSHVAYVIYARLNDHHDTRTLYKYISPMSSSFLYAFGTGLLLWLLLFSLSFLISMSPNSLCIDQEPSLFEHS